MCCIVLGVCCLQVMITYGVQYDNFVCCNVLVVCCLQVMISPPVISTSIFVMVIRMLAIMCASCPDLAVLLLKQSELSALHING